MKKRLNYYIASVETIAQHFATVSRQAISSAKKNHAGEPEILEKLERASELARLQKLRAKVAVMESCI